MNWLGHASIEKVVFVVDTHTRATNMVLYLSLSSDGQDRRKLMKLHIVANRSDLCEGGGSVVRALDYTLEGCETDS